MQQSEKRGEEEEPLPPRSNRMAAGSSTNNDNKIPSYLKGTSSSTQRSRSQSFDKNNASVQQQQSLESAQKTPKKHDVRRCITVRATLRDDICTMKLHVYMLHNNEWYLHSQSCLNHCNHPPLPPKAKAKSSVDMSPSSKTLVSTTN